MASHLIDKLERKCVVGWAGPGSRVGRGWTGGEGTLMGCKEGQGEGQWSGGMGAMGWWR